MRVLTLATVVGLMVALAMACRSHASEGAGTGGPSAECLNNWQKVHGVWKKQR